MSSLEDAMTRIDAICDKMEHHNVKVSSTIITELLKQAHREYMKELRPTTMPDFSEPRYNVPMVVYTIQNSQNHKVYIGKTTTSFCERYPSGKWWIETDNKDLVFDLEKYGYANFNVNIYLCDNEQMMDQYEATLINANWSLRYNRKPEPEVK
tara:strand:- start:170 stop:628 length:459 start_codon:yes stop_codon:yes gene_type:complete